MQTPLEVDYAEMLVDLSLSLEGTRPTREVTWLGERTRLPAGNASVPGADERYRRDAGGSLAEDTVLLAALRAPLLCCENAM